MSYSYKMNAIGLNNEVKAGGKKFHIQTNYLDPAEKIVSTIYENGKIILQKEQKVNGETTEMQIQELSNRIHENSIEEIELLYYISEKVHTIRHALSNFKLGSVFLKNHLVDDAIREFKTAIEIDSELIDAHKKLAMVYCKNGQYEEGILAIRTCLEKHADYPDLHYVLGNIYLDQNKYLEATEALEKALHIHPEYGEAHLSLVLVMLKKILDGHEPTSDKELIISHIQKAEKCIHSENLIKAYEYFDNDDLTKMFEVLKNEKEERQEKKEENLEDEFYLNFMFGGKGKDDEYIDNYVDRLQDLISKHQNYPDLRNDLGVAYLVQCRNLFLKALDEFREALKINPEYRKVSKNLKLAENDGKGFLILLRAILK